MPTEQVQLGHVSAAYTPGWIVGCLPSPGAVGMQPFPQLHSLRSSQGWIRLCTWHQQGLEQWGWALGMVISGAGESLTQRQWWASCCSSRYFQKPGPEFQVILLCPKFSDPQQQSIERAQCFTKLVSEYLMPFLSKPDFHNPQLVVQRNQVDLKAFYST